MIILLKMIESSYHYAYAYEILNQSLRTKSYKFYKLSNAYKTVYYFHNSSSVSDLDHCVYSPSLFTTTVQVDEKERDYGHLSLNWNTDTKEDLSLAPPLQKLIWNTISDCNNAN